MVVDIIIYIRKIFYEFFMISFYINLYLNDKFYYQIFYPIKIVIKDSCYIFNLPYVVCYHRAKFEL
jgi:hypothetical protein